MRNWKLLISTMFIFFIILLAFSAGMLEIHAGENDDFTLSFNIKTENITADTMIPTKQFQELGMKFYEINEGKTIIRWEDKILYLDTESHRANISGDSIELINKPLRVNNDLLLPYHLVEELIGKQFLEERITVNNKVEKIEEVILKVIPEMTEVSEEQNSIAVEVILMNNSNTLEKFTFNSGQKFDLKLTDQQGRKVYQWSRDKMFTQAIQHLELAAGEKEIWQTSIPLEDISPGTYQLEGWLTARDRRLEAESQEILIYPVQ